MKVGSLILLGQLKEAISNSNPNMQNRCRGLINSIIALETEEQDTSEEAEKDNGSV